MTGRPGDDPREPGTAIDGSAATKPEAPSPAIDGSTATKPATDDLEVRPDQLSLGSRLRQPRTILSLVLPLVLITLTVRIFLGIDLEELAQSIANANGALLLLAFGIFYLGFPLRGLRWVLLLRGADIRVGLRDSTEIIFLSWFVNCLVPAKLGDVYRAYLLKINSPVSLSRTFGTVFTERVLDLFVIAILGLGAAFWSFRTGLSPAVQVLMGLGVAVIVALGLGLLTMRNFGRRLVVRLPLPARVVELYDKFEAGVFGAFGIRRMPPLIFLTFLIWSTEGLRLFFVVEALNLPDVSLGLSGAFFVALIASLLTAVPFTPAGLGVVEAGIVGVLTIAYDVPVTQAATIALVDRAISVLSVIVFGAIGYALSSKRRGAGLRGVPASSPS